MIDCSKIKHKDIDIISVINLPLWDKACWKGVGFMYFPGTSPIPGLMVGFDNLVEGEKIFRGWSRFLNDKNLDELVDVSIIKGINKPHPAHYRVVINANFERFLRESAKGKRQMFVCRINTMEPNTSTNLDIFLELFEKAKKYYICPGDVNSFGYGEPCASDCIFWKTKLRVVNAWEIDSNDPFAVALQLDDDPIVPPDVENPPFLNALAFIKESKTRNEDD